MIDIVHTMTDGRLTLAQRLLLENARLIMERDEAREERDRARDIACRLAEERWHLEIIGAYTPEFT